MNGILIMALEFFYQMAGNLVPWWVIPWIVDERGQLRRVYAYGYGCAGILTGFVLWALSQHDPCINVWAAVRYLALLNMSAGMGTLAPRVLRLLVEQRALQGDREDYEQAHNH